MSLRARIRKLCDAPGAGDARCTEPAGHAGDFHTDGVRRWAFRNPPTEPQLPEWLKRSRLTPLGLAKDFTGSGGPHILNGPASRGQLAPTTPEAWTRAVPDPAGPEASGPEPDASLTAGGGCAGCGGPLPPGRHGQRRLTCSAACRQRAVRAPFLLCAACLDDIFLGRQQPQSWTELAREGRLPVVVVGGAQR
jgi:hypothetical protein